MTVSSVPWSGSDFSSQILASVSIVAYGVLLPLEPPILVSLLITFLICFCITAAYSVMNTLIVDLYHDRPATIMAANNLVRCFLGAGAAAVTNPLIREIGVQWSYCIVSAAVLLINPLLFLVYFRGWDWRKMQAEIDTQGGVVCGQPD